MLAKKKQVKTNAIRLVEQKKIKYTEHEYAWDEAHLSASSVAEQLSESEHRIYKTLVAVIPGNRELDLKKLARVSGNKKVEMLHLKDLEATTGYIRGGCSPIGMKKLFPTYLEQTAQSQETIIVSAGKRGHQMELAPQAICDLTKGTFADLVL